MDSFMPIVSKFLSLSLQWDRHDVLRSEAIRQQLGKEVTARVQGRKNGSLNEYVCDSAYFPRTLSLFRFKENAYKSIEKFESPCTQK